MNDPMASVGFRVGDRVKRRTRRRAWTREMVRVGARVIDAMSRVHNVLGKSIAPVGD